MRNLTIKKLLVSSFLCLGLSVTATGGEWYCDTAPCESEFDWQWFAPIHNVCEEPNPKAAEGYFYSAEHMFAYFLRPDRAAIGNDGPPIAAWLPNSVNFVFADNGGTGSGLTLPNNGNGTLSFLFPIVGGGANGLQFNSIDDAYTETGDGQGDRFTFGRINDDCGWSISVIFDVDVENSSRYGFDDKRIDQLGAAQGQNGVDGTEVFLIDSDGDGIVDMVGPNVAPTGAVAGIPAIISVDGLLSVAVNFNDPNNLLAGLIDANFDNVGDDVNGDGVIDAMDFQRIAVVFDDMTVENRTRMDGIEANLIRRKRRLRSGFDMEGYLGVRYLSIDDRFSVFARGGTLADSSWDNNADNRIVGPSFGFRASKQKRQWVTTLSAKFLAGANFLSIRQQGVIGDHLTTGHPGVPIALGGNDFFNRLGDERFSPVGEFKFETAAQLTRHINVKAGWTGMVIGNVARASNTVVYDLPTLGIRNGREEMFAHGLTVGFEINR